MRGYLYLCCLAGLAAGIAASRLLGIWSLLAIAPCLLMLLWYRAARGRWPALALVLPLSFALLGCMMFQASEARMDNGLLPAGARAGGAATVRGKVMSLPSGSDVSEGFFMDVDYVRLSGKAWRTAERLYVQTDGRVPQAKVFPGARLEATGRLQQPDVQGRWLADHGCACIMRASLSGLRTYAAPDPLSAAVAHAREWIASRYEKIFDKRIAGFVQGVSLSKTDRTDPVILADLRSCGLSHLVAVAGLHVGSAAMIALGVMAAIGAGRRSRFATAMLMALAVLALSNFRPSALRATIMAGACFGGAVAGRKYDSLVGVSVAGIAILAANPRALFDLAFQYSFAAALGIVLLLRLGDRTGSPGPLRAGIAVCAGAQLGILPLMLARGELAPVSAVIANLLVVWLVGALLVSSWCVALISAVSLPAAKVAAVFPGTIARYTLSVASTCARIPGAGLFMGALSAAALVMYAASLVMFAKRSRGGSLFRPAACLMASFVLVIASCFPVVTLGSRCSVTALDVGEGDAMVLADGTGATILVDGGPDPEIIIRKLRGRGIGRIDLMVLSHPHADHAAGLVEVVRRMPVGRILEPGLDHSSPGAYHDLLATASERRVPCVTASEGQSIKVSQQTRIEVLYAPSCLPKAPKNLNDCSIVAMAYMGGSRVLLCGDIESTGQDTLLGSHPALYCDLIKIPHQGAANAATRELLEAARPRLATISVGRDNKFGHPSGKCLSLLASRGVAVERTDLSGDILILMSNGRIVTKTNRR